MCLKQIQVKVKSMRYKMATEKITENGAMRMKSWLQRKQTGQETQSGRLFQVCCFTIEDMVILDIETLHFASERKTAAEKLQGRDLCLSRESSWPMFFLFPMIFYGVLQ